MLKNTKKDFLEIKIYKKKQNLFSFNRTNKVNNRKKRNNVELDLLQIFLQEKCTHSNYIQKYWVSYVKKYYPVYTFIYFFILFVYLYRQCPLQLI